MQPVHYMDVIVDHFTNPRNYGRLAAANVDREASNPACGDRLRIQASVNADGIVEAVRFTGSGCTVSVASASLLTTLIEGLPLEEAVRLPERQLLDAIDAPLSPRRYDCALLGYNVLRTGLIQFYHESRMRSRESASE